MFVICINFTRKGEVMKKVLKTLLAVLFFILAVNISFNTDCIANTKSSAVLNSKKLDIIVVRTQEGERTYINIYTDNGIFITKFEEL